MLFILLIVAAIIAFLLLRGCLPSPSAAPNLAAEVLPDPPSNITGQSAAIFNIPVQWQDNSDNEDGFRVYREGSDEPGVRKLVGETSANTPTFLDTETSCSVVYQYTIASYNEAGESPATECWQIALPPCPIPQPLSLPGGLAAGREALGAFYWVNEDGPVLKADQVGQIGLIDLGDIGGTPLHAVNVPPGANYQPDGVPAVEGHSYLAQMGDGVGVIVFTITGLASDALEIEYIIYHPDEAILSACGEPTPTSTSTATPTGTATLTITPSVTLAEDTPTVTATRQIITLTPTVVTPTAVTVTPGCTLNPNDGICCEMENGGIDPACPAPHCGSPCLSSAQCGTAPNGTPLACAGGVCWDACACGGDCGGEDNSCPCTCIYYAGNQCLYAIDCNGKQCSP